MEANPALRAVLVHMHPGDARAVEETMAKRLGSGQGRMRRFYTTLPTPFESLGSAWVDWNWGPPPGPGGVSGTGTGRLELCSDAPTAEEVTRGWWPHPNAPRRPKRLAPVRRKEATSCWA